MGLHVVLILTQLWVSTMPVHLVYTSFISIDLNLVFHKSDSSFPEDRLRLAELIL